MGCFKILPAPDASSWYFPGPFSHCYPHASSLVFTVCRSDSSQMSTWCPQAEVPSHRACVFYYFGNHLVFHPVHSSLGVIHIAHTQALLWTNKHRIICEIFIFHHEKRKWVNAFHCIYVLAPEKSHLQFWLHKSTYPCWKFWWNVTGWMVSPFHFRCLYLLYNKGILPLE